MGSHDPNRAIVPSITSAPRVGSSDIPEQPRQPRNLQGLLRFAMQATRAEDAPNNSELGPMDEERRQFLENVVKDMTVNVHAELNKSLTVLLDAKKIHSIQMSDPVPEDVQNAFQTILNYVDDIDIAKDFCTDAGLSCLPICFECQNDEVRALTSQVIGEICQNNPYCQARVLECGLLSVLLNMAQSESGKTLTKCVFAIACIVREYEPACSELVSAGGCGVLTALLQDADERVRIKSARLVHYLCLVRDDARDQFIELNIVKTIAEVVKSAQDSTTECYLRILQVLVRDLDPRVVKQFRDPKLNLKSILENYIKDPVVLESSDSEEIEKYQVIIKRVFDNYPPIEIVNDEADR